MRLPKFNKQLVMPKKDLQSIFFSYFEQLKAIAVTSIKWINLPSTINPVYLEQILFRYPYAIFFNDEVIGELALPCTLGGKLNFKGEPYKRRAYAENGYHRSLDMHNSVIIYNSTSDLTTEQMLIYYASNLAEIDMTMSTHLQSQKTPFMIQAPDGQQLSLKNMYQQIVNNVPVISTKDNFNGDLKVMNFNTPYIADKLQELKQQLWNEALTFLGVPNVSYQKKERMITDEVTRTMGGVTALKMSRLYMREQACEQINKMFPPLDPNRPIRVEFNVETESFNPNLSNNSIAHAADYESEVDDIG